MSALNIACWKDREVNINREVNIDTREFFNCEDVCIYVHYSDRYKCLYMKCLPT
jgi:hypothetical protein